MKRTGYSSSLALGAALGLALAAAPLLAQPGNGQGVGKGGAQQRGQGQETVQGSQGQGKHGQDQRGQGRSDERYREARHDDDRYRDRYRDREHDRDRDRDYRGDRRLRIDEREIRDIFHSRRDYLRYDERDSLPPGIRKNLARGKPLPPGIAKNFDSRLRRELPHYEGYEWRRVGADAVLVDITNDIIREVIHDILR